MILDTFPTPEEFYKTYWGKKPFIIRKYIPEEVITTFINGDTLAGLALEEDIKSRLIKNNEDGNKWVCEHGPLNEDVFDDIGNKNWSILVQNVEQYHKDTANLLPYFQFSPRWLLDDIMVSFSAPGGCVGPHTDSYHTFLVQGIGKRSWKISADQITDDVYVDNADMKVLKNGFEGEAYEVEVGDVIYMPPFFGHEGKTIEAAMTFSVGFLGPKMSDLLSEYALHLEENESINQRFLAEELDEDSASFTIGTTTVDSIRDNLISSLKSDNFSSWMAEYFSTPTHEEIEEPCTDKEINFLDKFKNGGSLCLLNHVKLSITRTSNGDYTLAILGEHMTIKKSYETLIKKLNNNQNITIHDCENSHDKNEFTEIISTLYQQNILTFDND